MNGKLLITDYLDATAARLAGKVAFADEKDQMTFGRLRDEAARIGTALIDRGFIRQPVAIKMDKSPRCIAAMMGAVYAGCFYTIIDIHMPEARAQRIMNTLQPAAVIDEENYSDYISAAADEDRLKERREDILETDILYVLFTSGSTGDPKGVILSHRAVSAYLEYGASVFTLDETAVFGNQAPFYFILSGFEIFHTIRGGGTTWIIPTELFSFPVRLLEYLNEKGINSIYWVPSVFTMTANFRALPEVHVDGLKQIFFGGEAMPAKQLNMWIDEYPDAVFANMYGPTEMTELSLVYIVDRRLDNNESVPIGKPVAHMDFMILDDEGKSVPDGEVGELCGRGPSLAYGYYNNPEATAKAFVQNPLQNAYEEKIYKSGDLVRINESGEYILVGRKDFQIKHMGHRIELGEIETAVSSLNGIEENACFYDTKKSRIICYYTGDVGQGELLEDLKSLLPEYMLPSKRIRLDVMPKNLNGKIDRKALKEGLG